MGKLKSPGDASPSATQRRSSGFAKRRLPRSVYVLIGALVALIAIVTFVPHLYPSAAIIYKPDVLRLVYFVLSAVVCVLIFGILGDSNAFVKYEDKSGLLIQVSGSAAGLVIFYYLLSSGLSPYTELTLSLFKNDQLVVDDDVEVSLLTLPTQTLTTRTGIATFAYVPKDQSEIRPVIRSATGRTWEIAEVTPSRCYNSETKKILSTCDQLEIHLSNKSLCLKEQSISNNDSSEIDTTLGTFIPRFAENFTRQSRDLSVSVVFSDNILKNKTHEQAFKMQRKSEAVRLICDQLSDIVGWFNRAHGGNLVRAYVSCSRIFISSPMDPQPDGAMPCN